MRSIGIRELRQNASKYLRLVRDGETIEVTDRGEPIATITPIARSRNIVARLRREGKVRDPARAFDITTIVPVLPEPNAPTVDEVLEEQRPDRL